MGFSYFNLVVKFFLEDDMINSCISGIRSEVVVVMCVCTQSLYTPHNHSVSLFYIVYKVYCIEYHIYNFNVNLSI